MPRVVFTPNLERHLSSPPRTVSGSTVRAALAAVFEENPRLKGYILDDQERLRKHVVIFVNNEQISDRHGLTDSIADADEVFVSQALSGGCVSQSGNPAPETIPSPAPTFEKKGTRR